jgi:hypothetical protein
MEGLADHGAAAAFRGGQTPDFRQSESERLTRQLAPRDTLPPACRPRRHDRHSASASSLRRRRDRVGPPCGYGCRPKCGEVNIWHWAHHARGDCDPWSEPVTEWHLGWQAAVPPERREVVIGSHRADIVTASGGVVEIQHSPITAAVIAAREEFYGSRMAWIFDATRADITMADVRASRYGVCGCDPGTCSGGWGAGPLSGHAREVGGAWRAHVPVEASAPVCLGVPP